MGHLAMLPYQIFSTDDENIEIQHHQELKPTRRIHSKRIWKLAYKKPTELGVHLSQKIKLKYHKINCFGPDYVVQKPGMFEIMIELVQVQFHRPNRK